MYLILLFPTYPFPRSQSVLNLLNFLPSVSLYTGPVSYGPDKHTDANMHEHTQIGKPAYYHPFAKMFPTKSNKEIIT